MPWWLRAYLLVGAVQGLAIGLTGLFRPAHVVGFPLATTPLNTRFVAAFYLAGATGLIASAAARRAVDTRIFVVGFVAVTALLLAATVWYWSTYTAGGVPYPWVGSYVVEPVVGAASCGTCTWARAAQPGRHRLSAVFLAEAVVFAALGVVLVVAPLHGGAPVAVGADARCWRAPTPRSSSPSRSARCSPPASGGGGGAAVRAQLARAGRDTAVVSLVHHAKFDGGAVHMGVGGGLAAGLAGFAAASAAHVRAAA